MQDLRPENLTNEELRHYASLYDLQKLPQEWLLELAKRFTYPQAVRPQYR